MVIMALTSAVNNPARVIQLRCSSAFWLWASVSVGEPTPVYAINPARDFAPRVASWLTGYHDAMYSTNGPQLYFWLPIVAPLIGGLVGGAIFVFGIERFLPAAITEPRRSASSRPRRCARGDQMPE